MVDIIDFRPYLGNKKLKRVGVKQQMTQEQVDEYVRCAQDPEYFIQRYVKIITLDRGLVHIDLFDWQKGAVNTIKENRQVIIKAGRQIGKTTVTVGFLLWYVLF